jgi:hypothetical protein
MPEELHVFTEKPPTFEDDPVTTTQDVDRLLIKADQTRYRGRRNGGIISAAVMRIIKNSSYTMRYIETRYRALDSRTYLIARPADQAPPNVVVCGLDHQPLPYSLWVGVNGMDNEAHQMLYNTHPNAHGMRYQDLVEHNLDNLLRTGFMMMKSN